VIKIKMLIVGVKMNKILEITVGGKTCANKVKVMRNTTLVDLERCYYCETYNGEDNTCGEYRAVKNYQIPVRQGRNAMIK
jgi:hypothetical protein